MAEAQKASFSFTEFKVPVFSFKDSEKSNPELNLKFNPSGKYNSKTGVFELHLDFIGKEDDGNQIISINSISKFKFSEAVDFNSIPPFFYSNSIAIVFPYLRAFISTLTMQANVGTIMLGLMNFTGMGEELKKETKKYNGEK